MVLTTSTVLTISTGTCFSTTTVSPGTSTVLTTSFSTTTVSPGTITSLTTSTVDGLTGDLDGLDDLLLNYHGLARHLDGLGYHFLHHDGLAGHLHLFDNLFDDRLTRHLDGPDDLFLDDPRSSPGTSTVSPAQAATNANSIAVPATTTNQRSELDVRTSLSPSFARPQGTPIRLEQGLGGPATLRKRTRDRIWDFYHIARKSSIVGI